MLLNNIQKGPGNTICALNKTLQLAAQYPGALFGLETDVRFSADGVPFLVHHASLARTTNIASFSSVVSPSTPMNQLSSSFIEQLDSGSWWVDSNPFGTPLDV